MNLILTLIPLIFGFVIVVLPMFKKPEPQKATVEILDENYQSLKNSDKEE